MQCLKNVINIFFLVFVADIGQMHEMKSVTILGHSLFNKKL